jgi:hypothetical protein
VIFFVSVHASKPAPRQTVKPDGSPRPPHIPCTVETWGDNTFKAGHWTIWRARFAVKLYRAMTIMPANEFQQVINRRCMCDDER